MGKLVFSQRIEDLRKSESYKEPVFSRYQQKLYKSRFYGLNVYSRRELKRMSISDKLHIQAQHERTKEFINDWKLNLINSRSNGFIKSLFSHSPVAKKFVSLRCKQIDPDLKDEFNFSKMGISKRIIALKMVEAGLLPKNFFNWQKSNKKHESLYKI